MAALAGLLLALAGHPAAAQLVTVLDAAGDVGAGSDVAYGPDGRALVSYLDATNGALKVAACHDVACTSAALHTVDASGAVTGSTSIAFGHDGLARISYQAGTAVRLARCADGACSTATLATVDTVSALWPGTVVGVGGDGLPILAYSPAGLGLRVAHCDDAACGSATVTTYEGSVGVSLTIGGDGRALVAASSSGASVRIYHCADAACTTATVGIIFGVPSGGPAGQSVIDPSLTTRPDGTGLVAVTRAYNSGLSRVELFRCVDAGCTDPAGASFGIDFAVAPSLALTTDDRVVVAFHAAVPSTPQLKATSCAVGHTGCTIQTIDAPGIGQQPEIAVDPAGIGLVSYRDEASGDLRVAYLGLPPGVSISDASVIEGNSGTTFAAFPVTVSGPANGTVSFATSPGTATAPSDYTAVSGTLTFTPGTTTLVVTVPVVGDTAVEPHESFFVDLSNPIGLTITDGQGLGTILNDDAQSLLSIGDDSAAEGASGPGGMLQLPVRLDPVSPLPVTVEYATADLTAVAGVDYQPRTGTLTFAPGSAVQIVTVFAFGDLDPEPDETFFVRLSNPQGATIGDGEAVGTILNDDEPPLRGELGHGSRYEGALIAATSKGAVDDFLVALAPYASYEVVADAVSGDAVPLTLDRRTLAGTVLQSGTPVGTGAARTLRWLAGTTAATEVVRVAGACGASCQIDDTYRVRAYETTLRASRFNNTGDQTTVLVLSNPGDVPIALTVRFWGPDGTLLGSHAPAGPLAPHAVLVLDTADAVRGASGSLTIAHDGPYGGLVGKAVALEPSTGFAFDTPLEPRRR
ncbi:MAG: Calx-beta domain-containing protein [Vicinamibacteria bacterium]